MNYRYLLMRIILANDVELNPGPSYKGNNYIVFYKTPTNLIFSRTRTHAELDEEYKKQLYNQLTSIKPTDYIGKDYCRVCWKAVHSNHRSVSCDHCSYWCHLKCTDLPLRTYLENRGTAFAWLCNICRTDEPEPDVSQLRCPPNKSPQTPLNNLAGKRGLILHLNCRSLNGKFDEVKNILHIVKPDVLVLTETWLNDTNPKGALTQTHQKG